QNFIVDTPRTEPFRQRVHRLQNPSLFRGDRHNVYLRMGNTEVAPEAVGFPKDHILHTRFESFVNPVDALKPNELYLAAAILKVAYKSLLISGTDKFFTDHSSSKLNIGHLLFDFADAVKSGSIFIAKRVMLNQVSISEDVQFFIEQSRTLRTYSFQILDRCVKKSRHSASGQYSKFHYAGIQKDENVLFLKSLSVTIAFQKRFRC